MRPVSVKGSKTISRGSMKQYNIGVSFERIAIDNANPFPSIEYNNKYILDATDYFSKLPEADAIPNQEASKVAREFVENLFKGFRVPIE